MSLRRLEAWVREGMSWRMRNWRAWYFNRVVGPLSARSSALARRAFCPIPGLEPFRRSHLHVYRPGALGDVLLCTPALREVKRLNPTCRISFYTNFPQPIEGLPFIDEVKKSAERPSGTINLTYEHRIPPTRHIARIFGDVLGVSVRDVRPTCLIDKELVAGYRSLFRSLPRPHIVVNRNASYWTPNKEWPVESWEQLVVMLTKVASVIEIGAAKESSSEIAPGNYLSLLGKTTVPELIAVIAAADVLVSPISGPVHMAAAAGIPAVVIYGGYEHPLCSRYAGNINLYTPAECSPCWLRSPCPYDKKCLRAILPARVLQAIHALIAKKELPSRNEAAFARSGS